MASRPPSYHQDHRRSISNPSIHQIPHQDSDPDEEEEDSQKPALPVRPKEKPKTLPGSPAYVSPIPKIGRIPSINTPDKGREREKPVPISPNMPTRPKLPPFVGSFLCGKTIDESGDIRDNKTGQLLARAGGDLPSIVGRKVSNSQGDILGDDGELLGYVADVEIERKSPSQSPRSAGGRGAPRSLFEVVGGSKAALMVDGEGNILDGEGNVVGKFHDNNNPMMRKRREEGQRERAEKENGGGEKGVPEETGSTQVPQQPVPEEKEERQERPPRRTEEERRENAQAWRKENPGESPSDIFLDVKSTTEGIQLTIRIPTVFGGQQVRPNISFS
ncbi:hypothetical protein B0T14DRAFT_420755 [Immersiella caudata]|uniref:Uncharacterized protein n=1 Tax=Immersiella caudata TaxID=314043 RepID=A0AA40C7A8_9PEZI|nr:hypothetical protein B0T14DRAFT_420755 [Immersiella caudata]